MSPSSTMEFILGLSVSTATSTSGAPFPLSIKSFPTLVGISTQSYFASLAPPE
jgi:hypothetical protein